LSIVKGLGGLIEASGDGDGDGAGAGDFEGVGEATFVTFFHINFLPLLLHLNFTLFWVLI
jgi:hypothetical protein